MTLHRRGFLAALGGALALPATARAQLLPGQFAQQLTFGINVPLSGPLEEYGRQVVRGVEAAIDESNRYNAPLTRAFGIRTFDDQNSSAVATSNIAVAQNDPSIVAMIGNLTAEVTLASLPQYANANFALVVPSVTTDDITSRGYRNVFRLPTKDSSEGQLFARAVLQGRHAIVTRAIMLEGTYGADVARGFVAQAKADRHDADVVILTKNAVVDPAGAAKVILGSKPTYLFLCGKPATLGPIVEALRLANYTGEFGASDGFYMQATLDSYAKPLDGALVASSMPPLHRIPSMITVVSDMERYLGSVSAFSAYGYAAAQLLISAIGRVNAKNRFSLLSALQQNGSYDLLVGNYSFDFRGDATLPNIYLYTVTKDGFTFARPAVRNGFVV